jgi:hypothetical protein
LKVVATVLYALMQPISEVPLYTFQHVHQSLGYFLPNNILQLKQVCGVMFKNLCLEVSP